jgi:hypothetical protein
MSRKLMRVTKLVRCATLAAGVVAAASCGDVIRSSRSPVMLAVNSLTAGDSTTLLSDVVSDAGTVSDDQGAVTLTVIMKDVSVSPTTNNRVTVNRYRVEYRRADGHNIPGVDVPHPFDGVATVGIAAGASGAFSFELVRHIAKLESPLVQLRSNLNVISTIAQVTFFGTDQVGNDVSAVGSMLINFADIADPEPPAEEPPPEEDPPAEDPAP